MSLIRRRSVRRRTRPRCRAATCSNRSSTARRPGRWRSACSARSSAPAMWAVASHTHSHQYTARGRMAALVSAGAALVIGAAPVSSTSSSTWGRRRNEPPALPSRCHARLARFEALARLPDARAGIARPPRAQRVDRSAPCTASSHRRHPSTRSRSCGSRRLARGRRAGCGRLVGARRCQRRAARDRRRHRADDRAATRQHMVLGDVLAGRGPRGAADAAVPVRGGDPGAPALRPRPARAGGVLLPAARVDRSRAGRSADDAAARRDRSDVRRRLGGRERRRSRASSQTPRSPRAEPRRSTDRRSWRSRSACSPSPERSRWRSRC